MEPDEPVEASGSRLSFVFARLRDLEHSAEVLALLRAWHRSGLTELLTSPRSTEELCGHLQLPVSRVDAALGLLQSYGIVEQRGDLWAFSSGWELMASSRTAWDPAALLMMGGVRVHQIERCLDQAVDYWRLDSTDRLAVATGMSVNPQHAAEMVRNDLERLDGIGEALSAGGRVLELGCGVGSRITAVALAYPTASAVGVELADDLAEYGRERATELGVADRVRFVLGDATTYEPDGTFDLVGWSQFFFPEPSRIATLRTARRALRPGGWVTAPALWDGAKPEPGSAAHRNFAADRLMLDLWGVPMKSAYEVADEMASVGFADVRVDPSVGRWFVHGRQP